MLDDVRPELRAHLERSLAAPAPSGLSFAEARAAYVREVIEEAGPGAPVAEVRDLRMGGEHGVPMRTYLPDGEGTRGAVLYLHGGGWSMGSIEGCDALCRALARAAGAVVVSVGYRLAPEHPFPAALEDSWRALRWLAREAPALGADPARLAVAGESAGANLAAALALRAVAAGPSLRLQVLVYPALDAAMDSVSYRELGAGYGLTSGEMAACWADYLQGADPAAAEASPLRAPDLRGLAPALVLTASHDPLRDEGEEYARRLRAAGVEVEAMRVPGTLHGFLRMLAVTPVAGESVAVIGAALWRAL